MADETTTWVHQVEDLASGRPANLTISAVRGDVYVHGPQAFRVDPDTLDLINIIWGEFADRARRQRAEQGRRS